MIRTALIIVLALGGAASAQQTTIPANFTGEWCYAPQDPKIKNETSYRLSNKEDDCNNNKFLLIYKDRFYNEGRYCKLINIKLTKDVAPSGTAYIAAIKASCQQEREGQTSKLQRFEFNRYKGYLTILENNK